MRFVMTVVTLAFVAMLLVVAVLLLASGKHFAYASGTVAARSLHGIALWSRIAIARDWSLPPVSSSWRRSIREPATGSSRGAISRLACPSWRHWHMSWSMSARHSYTAFSDMCRGAGVTFA